MGDYMLNKTSYGQFCPVARAAEIVTARWTPVLLRELMAGSTKFNDLRMGLPLMSPSLLSKRLSELEVAGIVDKVKAVKGRGHEYLLTDSGKELAPIIMTLGVWGQKFIMQEFAESELDPTLLMWDIQRRLDTSFFPKSEKFVAYFYLVGAPQERRNWWLIIDDRKVDLCTNHPGHKEDISIEACLRGLTEVWMGQISVAKAKEKGFLIFDGNKKYIKSFKDWFLLSPFANEHPNFH
jgi:DNA-binding HxlR family transcriptional regulator